VSAAPREFLNVFAVSSKEHAVAKRKTYAPIWIELASFFASLPGRQAGGREVPAGRMTLRCASPDSGS
jgi:hypothetical protein